MKRLSKSAKMRGAIFALLLAFTMSVAAQVQVRGTVLDERGEAAIGAMVQVDGTNIGASVGFDGTFTIPSAPQGGTLVITFVGYREQRVPVSANIGIIRLVPDTELLGEVIVVGFGSGRTPTSVVGQITRVDGSVLQNRPVANVMDALQGQVPGLQIFTSSGEPSAISSIRLHGSGSLGASSEPLIVLDGVPIEGITLRSLNPRDFESVTVLRDASATAIYGSRAANGVIFITTRRGVVAERATVTISGNFGWSQLANTAFWDDMMTTDQLLDFWLRSGIRSEAYVAAIDRSVNTRWREQLFKDRAGTGTIDVSISGGAGRTNYFISAGFTQQDGMAWRSMYERWSLRSNINTEVNSWLRTGLNFALSHDDWQSNPNFATNALAGGLGFLRQPFFRVTDDDGNRLDWITEGNFAAPWYWAENNQQPLKSAFLNTTGFFEVRPIEGLTLRAQAGLEAMDQDQQFSRNPNFRGNPAGMHGARTVWRTRRATTTFTNTAEYRFSVQDDHNFSILAGHEYINFRSEQISAGVQGLTDHRLMGLGVGTAATRTVGSTLAEWAFLSFFGRAEYNFMERYFLDFSLRNDASSRFGRENRNALFWAAGGMWHLHQEEFMQDVHWLNTLSLRLSTGTSGNSAIGNYAHLATVSTLQQYAGGVGWVLGTPGNPNLGWEQQFRTSLGIRVEMFNRRLRGDISMYDRVTSNMLVSVPQPWTGGFNSITENVGRLRNRGIDFRIDGDVWRDNRRGGFFTPYITFNYNRETVLELFQDRDYWIIPNTGVAWVVGMPRQFIYPIWAGVNPETGRPQWYQRYPGDEGRIQTRRDPNYVTSTFNTALLEQIVGKDRFPPINGGWGFSAGLRGFHLQADFSFSLGKWMISNDAFFAENPRNFAGFNTRYTVNDFWTPENRNARFPSPDHMMWTEFDSRLIDNASFMRLKNLTLGYVFPRNVVERTNFFSDMRVFLTGRNLLTWTNFRGPDPEHDSNLSLGINPNTMQFSAGFELSF